MAKASPPPPSKSWRQLSPVPGKKTEKHFTVHTGGFGAKNYLSPVSLDFVFFCPTRGLNQISCPWFGQGLFLLRRDWTHNRWVDVLERRTAPKALALVEPWFLVLESPFFLNSTSVTKMRNFRAQILELPTKSRTLAKCPQRRSLVRRTVPPQNNLQPSHKNSNTQNFNFNDRRDNQAKRSVRTTAKRKRAQQAAVGCKLNQ